MLAKPGFASDKSVVVTTTATLKSIVKEILPSAIAVESLAQKEQDPHHLEIDTKHILLAKKAKLFVAIGFDLETSWLDKLLKTSAADASVFYTSQKIKSPIAMGGHDHSHKHNRFNPHFLQSPAAVLDFISALQVELIKLYPDYKDEIGARSTAFIKTVKEKDMFWKNEFAKLKNKNLITYHESLEYFATNFGLKVVNQVESAHGVSPGPIHIKRLLTAIAEKDIKCIVYDTGFSSAQIEQTKKIFPKNLKWVQVPAEAGISETDTYFTWFDKVAGNIRACLD